MSFCWWTELCLMLTVWKNFDGRTILITLGPYHEIERHKRYMNFCELIGLNREWHIRSFKTARIEANYSPDIITKIEAGRLIAIPKLWGLIPRITILSTRLQTSIQCIKVCRHSIVTNLEPLEKNS